ncbi:TIGR03767 family metallophosphoesterase [Streptomyces sp. RPA4-5]|uniref:TIGR03767 family metallophosphoesterase n=1 Tax=Streptomyces TaxID=1883 RepID=UPI00143E7BDD|nr:MULTISPECIES: TIGR03767 family metallophosphoesterase [Streptomyces]MCX4634409.1 TIGR03767 family metallophosphoesterase [Streptomyces platensis]QIY55551.1 TIGR03767 family metallophosphoesterase [Streptomyces sp. RPA4-5]WJY38293.1 TIGR03767 family metallophosphoesterase [Streptomyces sp. P9-2B-2]
MSRIRSAAATLDRRTFLAATGAVGAATGLGLALGPERAAQAATVSPGPAPAAPVPVEAPAVPRVPYTRGTTLGSVSAPRGSGGYRRLGDGPAWNRVVRSELGTAHGGRDGRRTALASFVQFTDLHLVDVQSPLRYEYLRAETASAWRPQEALSVAGVVSLIERVNALPGGPATGAPLSFVMTTGDNTDNNSKLELEWYLTAMSGGKITPNSGDRRRYEGVQDSGLKLYWQPDSAVRDADKKLGFPRLDGFLEAAIRTVHSPGLRLPWYSTVGNHDSLPGGCYAPGDPFWTQIATGERKLETLPAAEAAKVWKAVKEGLDPKGEDFKRLLTSHAKQSRRVTPDERRAPFTRTEYLRAHLDPAHTGPGPHGHGYTAAHLDGNRLYYSFRISDDVLGISLDTTDPGGHYTGSVGDAQLRWLERTLKDNEKGEKAHVLVFSHHTSKTMNNTRPDPARPQEKRHTGAELVEVLAAHPGVVGWINGHSHKNEIIAHDGFWEISTASHIDFPQLARVIELVDNHDGTLSLFTTLVESAAPHRTDFSDLSQTGLAALYRELSFNAPQARTDLAGTSGDRNVELLLKR